MAEETQMNGLDRAIRARLDATTEHNYPEMQAMRDALLAVLDAHPVADDGSGDLTVCKTCCGPSEDWERYALPWPCPTVLGIAEKLGVEHG